MTIVVMVFIIMLLIPAVSMAVMFVLILLL